MRTNLLSRRDFLRTTASAAIGLGAASIVPAAARARTASANDTIGVAVVGLRFGRRHIQRVLGQSGVRLVALCDLDPAVLQQRLDDLNGENVDVFATTEYRKVLERSDVDVVVIATSNHWHALHTVWACQAGKDVYVEKPVSHTIWEGRRMIEAAARYDRIVQAGTQARSAEGLPELIGFLGEGHLGRIRYVHALSTRHRSGIGRELPWYPDNVDYDRFCGKTPMVPLERNRLHYDWHWMWETGNGDLGNLGIHVFDRACWVAGHEGPPRSVVSMGGRFNLDDAGETPNAQLTICDYPEVPIIIENRSLPAPPGGEEPLTIRGARSGIIVECEGGYFVGSNGGRAFDRDGNLLREFPGRGAGNHFPNFIEAVRSRRSSDLNAPIDVAHASNTGCLLGNISYRIGKEAGLEEIRGALDEGPFGGGLLENFGRYLNRYGVDPEQTPLRLGGRVDFDSRTETIERVDGTVDDTRLEKARFLVKGSFRPPYQMAGEPDAAVSR